MLNRKHYIAYTATCLIWGSTWAAIKTLVRDVPPVRAAALRCILASIVLLLAAIVRNPKARLGVRQLRALIILGFAMMAVPIGLVFWAEYRISSSMTAVLFSSQPLFVSLLMPLTMGTRVPRRALFAMLVAFGGICALFYEGLSLSAAFLLGGGAVMLAVAISSWASVYAKAEISDVDPVLGTGIQFAVSAAGLFAASLILERGRTSDWNQTSFLALGFLVVFGSVVAFTLYYWLLARIQPYQIAMITVVIPVIALIEGALLLRESVPLLMMGAATVVLASVAVVLRVEDDLPLALDLNVSNTSAPDRSE